MFINMVNCGKCGKKIGFFEKKYECMDKNNHKIICCENCNSKSKSEKTLGGVNKFLKEKENKRNFDSDMKIRFEYLIQRLENNDHNIKPPEDPSEYTGGNCWVCFDDYARWYNGFRRLCSDCTEVLESGENLNKSISSISKKKKQKREFFIKEQERIKKESKERVIRLKKEEQEKEKLKEKNAPLVFEYCKKYLQNKDFGFKGIILGIYKNENLFKRVEEETLDFLQQDIDELYQETQKSTPSTSADYDKMMYLEATWEGTNQLIQDMIKLKKLLDKKGIKTDYIQIIEEMTKIVEQEMKKNIEKLTIPAYKRISKITTNDKKRIIKEYLKLGFDEPNEMIILDLFEKFGLKSNNQEIQKLLNDCVEENDLEDFENNLGLETKKKIKDFSNLNGHQFEDYLKELFSILGYQVMRTKLSGDQGADLIIKKDDEKTVVQAKKYLGSVTNKAIQEVVASKKHYGAEKAMVVTTGTFTKSAIVLAKSNKVELWDKNKLKGVVNEINKSSNTNKCFETKDIRIVTTPGSNEAKIKCNYCNHINILKIKWNKNKAILPEEFVCQNCDMVTSLKLISSESTWTCDICKKKFTSKEEAEKHEKKCK